MLFKREQYQMRIRPYYGKEVIKVITGQRRSGKSSLLKMIYNELCENNPTKIQLFINMELHEYSHIRTAEDLLSEVSLWNPDHVSASLFIDEVQDISSFELALRSLLAEGIYDIYCSGSNSSLLSGELASLLAGRYVEFRLYTLTYPEFLTFHGLSHSDKNLLKFFQFGGLPFLRNLELKQEITRDYIDGIYRTVLLKDVVERYSIRNPYFLEQLVSFCADNVGSLITAKNISDYLKSQHQSIAPKTVLDYLQYFVNACFLHRARRYDLKGKRILETNEKYYFEDVGIRNHIVGYKPTDMGKILENVVYHHLLASGYSVTIGTLNSLEIDFVATKDQEHLYIQVCYLLHSQETIDREFGNLLKISDNYPKYVVSMDPAFSGSVNGVRHLHIGDFLQQFPFEG